MIDGHRDRMINRFLYGRKYILAFYHIYYVTLLHNCTKIILCVKGACHEIFYHIFFIFKSIWISIEQTIMLQFVSISSKYWIAKFENSETLRSQNCMLSDPQAKKKYLRMFRTLKSYIFAKLYRGEYRMF